MTDNAMLEYYEEVMDGVDGFEEGGEYFPLCPHTKRFCFEEGWRHSKDHILGLLRSDERIEALNVPIAEAYVMIPKGTPWETASERLADTATEALIALITEDAHGK